MISDEGGIDMRSDNLYWVWLACRLGAANPDFQRLIVRYENPYDIYDADSSDIALTQGLSERTVRVLEDKSLVEASDIIAYCARTEVGIIPYSDNRYPNRLRLLKDPPALLYVKGELPDMDSLVCIAVVGTRRMSAYGRECAYRISYELGAAGAAVVSGMALGIDGTAACGAINGKGRTVAVLGSGIDIIYPREHTQLFGHIIVNGAVVTEYPPGTPPAGENFPRRNRIISGMCQGALIIEADAKSGAMITARTASEQGRQIFAIPGNIGEENTEGTNMLIHDGAIVVIDTEDIFNEYTYLYGKSINTARLRAARLRYRYDDEVLDRMGVCARIYHGDSGRTNTPSAPANQFRAKKEKKSHSPKFTAENYISNAKPAVRAAAVATAVPNVDMTGDSSDDVLRSLDEKQRKLFEEIPIDRAIPIDALAKLGYGIGEIMSTMTVLEVKGLVSSLPGGLYIRR